MKEYDYQSIICNYCRYTDYGWYPVGTGYWNLCEGCCCKEAYETYREENPDDTSELEELF